MEIELFYRCCKFHIRSLWPYKGRNLLYGHWRVLQKYWKVKNNFCLAKRIQIWKYLPVIRFKKGSNVPFLTSIKSCIEYKLGPSTKCCLETKFRRIFSSEAILHTEKNSEVLKLQIKNLKSVKIILKLTCQILFHKHNITSHLGNLYQFLNNGKKFRIGRRYVNHWFPEKL